MIIGITGTLGAGKGTVVDYLKTKGFAHYSSSSILKDILKERGLPQTREYMSPLANELMKTYEGGILHFSHERALKDGVQNYVLEAIHRENEAAYVRKIGGAIIGVDADLEIRHARITKRHEGQKDEVSYEQFLKDVEREDEGEGNTGPNIRAVMKQADAIVMNNGSKEDLFAQVEVALQKLAQK